jgi:uncharacterized protein (UPF0332 family)
MSSQEGQRKALASARLRRARQHLKAARDLLVNEDFADSISRSYYAIFQAARALLAIEQLESRKHSGVIALFNRYFVKTGKADKQLGIVLKDARRSREMADYSDVVEFAREDAEGQLQDAEMFVEAVTKLVEEKGENRTS